MVLQVPRARPSAGRPWKHDGVVSALRIHRSGTRGGMTKVRRDMTHRGQIETWTLCSLAGAAWAEGMALGSASRPAGSVGGATTGPRRPTRRPPRRPLQHA